MKEFDLKHMLPFLEEKELEELAEKIAESSDGIYQGISIANIMPFLDDDYIGGLFVKYLKSGKSVDIMLPFVDDDYISEAVDSYINGEMPGFPLTKALPFMDEDDVAKLARKAISSESQSINGLGVAEMLPFMDDDDVDSLFTEALKQKKEYSYFLPFVSDDVLSEIIDDYLDGKEDYDIDIDKIYPFLDEDDIRRLFMFKLHSQENKTADKKEKNEDTADSKDNDGVEGEKE